MLHVFCIYIHTHKCTYTGKSTHIHIYKKKLKKDREGVNVWEIYGLKIFD